MSQCFYCGEPADIPLKISDNFTTGASVRCCHSTEMCRECHDLMFGDRKRCLYWNPNRLDKKTRQPAPGWTLLWTRNTSWLISQGDRFPKFSDTPQTVDLDGKATTGIVISELPTRAQIREWLVTPPAPPFCVAIAESGQKHIRYLAQPALNRVFFPVQFETDCLHLDHARFVRLLTACEELLEIGFSKTEVLSGQYRPDRIGKNLAAWGRADQLLQPERLGGQASRLLQLVAWVSRPIKNVNPVDRQEHKRDLQGEER